MSKKCEKIATRIKFNECFSACGVIVVQGEVKTFKEYIYFLAHSIISLIFFGLSFTKLTFYTNLFDNNKKGK